MLDFLLNAFGLTLKAIDFALEVLRIESIARYIVTGHDETGPVLQAPAQRRLTAEAERALAEAQERRDGGR